MNWTPVESKAMSRVGYDAAAYVLGIEAHPNKDGVSTQYFYIDVPPEEHAKMMAAESVGKYWISVIKPKYQCRKGDGTAAKQSPAVKPLKPLEPGIGEVIAKAAQPEPLPVLEVPNLAISFGSGLLDPQEAPEMPLARLQEQMDIFFIEPMSAIINLSNQARTMTVASEEDYIAAAGVGAQLKVWRQRVEAQLKPVKKSIDSVKAVVLDKEKQLVRLAEGGEGFLGKICTDYRVAERTRNEMAARAETERLRKEAEDKRLAEAERAQAAGRAKLADALLSSPVLTPTVKAEAAVSKGTGAVGKVNYRYRVLNLAEVPREWLILDEKTVGQYARDKKLADGTVLNGIEFFTKEDTHF